MIIGIGNDLVDIRRIEKTLSRFKERFTNRVFTHIEREKSDKRKSARAASYAKRFAAKEACAKALGTGISQGVYWSDIGIVNQISGKPSIKLTGGAKKKLIYLTPENYVPLVHLSMSDDFPYAQAVVIIYAALNESPLSDHLT